MPFQAFSLDIVLVTGIGKNEVDWYWFIIGFPGSGNGTFQGIWISD